MIERRDICNVYTPWSKEETSAACTLHDWKKKHLKPVENSVHGVHEAVVQQGVSFIQDDLLQGRGSDLTWQHKKDMIWPDSTKRIWSDLTAQKGSDLTWQHKKDLIWPDSTKRIWSDLTAQKGSDLTWQHKKHTVIPLSKLMHDRWLQDSHFHPFPASILSHCYLKVCPRPPPLLKNILSNLQFQLFTHSHYPTHPNGHGWGWGVYFDTMVLCPFLLRMTCM